MSSSSSSSSSSDSSTTTYENSIDKFRSMVKERKNSIWCCLKLVAGESRDSTHILELHEFLRNAEVEFVTFATENKLERKELEKLAEIVYPKRHRKLMELLLTPLYFGHFTIWRLYNITRGSTLETNIVLDDAAKLPQAIEEYQLYMKYFTNLSKELRTGYLNANEHLDTILVTLLRTIAASYVKNEMKQSDNELKCTWYQELVYKLRQWCEELKLIPLYEIALPHIHKDVVKLLVEQIYRIIIIDFPTKYRTIFTMRYCMRKTNNYGRDSLTKSLINDVEKYLLLASVETKVILNAYAACVESLKELDATCVVLHRVCAVMKDYLKKRPDTVQQIISYITSDKKEELEKDMSKSKRSAMMDEDELKGVNDEFLPENMDTSGWYDWEPHPADAPIGEGQRGRQGVDVFNMLVSVYGSKELFVKEYRTLLADRLSNSDKKDPEFEKRYLDLLKLRFQYSELQHCEVMLRDMELSQKIDKEVQSQGVPVSACIISTHYWPKIEAEKSEKPMVEPLENALEKYAEVYSSRKDGRKLNWLKGVGVVEVELELEGCRIEKTVTNLQAAVLYLMLEKESWTVLEVAEKLGITNALAKRRLEWWTKQGLLVVGVAPGSTTEMWSLTRNVSTLCSTRPKSPDMMEEEDGGVDDSSEMVEALEQYWSYTQNYIANHAVNGEVKAERMHRVYRMFGSPTSAGPTLEHVNTFLQRKVQLGLLTFSNGFYRVVQRA